MAKQISITAEVETTPLSMAVTGAPGGAGVAVAYSSASSNVTISNTGADVQYKVGSGAWVEMERQQGDTLPINLAVTTLSFRRATLDGGAASVEIAIDGIPTLKSGASTIPTLSVDASGNVAGIAGPGGKIYRAGDISRAYKFFIPGNQFVGSGSAKDLSGNGANLAFRSAATDAETWANAGYFSSAAGVSKGLVIPKAAANLSFGAENSLLFSVALKNAAPGAGQLPMGWGVSSQSGVYFQYDPDGKITTTVVTNSLQSYYAGTTVPVNDGTEHVLTVGFDGPTKSVYMWRDGILCSSYVGLWAASTSGEVTQTPDFCFGNFRSQGTDAAVASIGRGLHCLKFTGGLPTNVGAIAQQLGAAPLLPITAGLVGY